MRFAAPCLAWTLALVWGAWGQAHAHHETGALEVQFRSVAVPQNQVPSLAQDPKGFLWVATSDGLMRFDGYRLRPIEQGSGTAVRRNLGWIRALSPGRDGRMWIGSDTQGLLSYDPGRDRVESHGLALPGGQARAVIRALLEDGEGQVWIATLGQGLLRYRPATAQLEVEALRWQGQPEARVMALHRSAGGTLWAGHWRGLAQRVEGRWQDVALPDAPNGVTVLSLLEDDEGRLWFGTQDGRLGVLERGRARWVLTQLQVAVHALAQARDGMLWVGTKSGLLWVDPVSGAIRQRLRPDARRPLGLAGSDISQLLRDQDGAMWVAGYGVGLQRHQHHPAFGVRGADLQPNAPLAEPDVRSVLGLRDGRVLATTQTGLVVELDGRPEQGLATRGIWPRERRSIVEFMAEGPDGNLWMASAGRLEQRSPAGRLLRDWALEGGRAQQILPRANGEVWLGMQEGLYRLDSAQAAQLQRVQPPSGPPLNGAVYALAEDPRDASLWVGGQLGLYRWQQQRLQPVTEAPGEGLGASIVLALLMGRDGTLWVDTAVSGLHRLRGADTEGRMRFERISERLGVDGRFGGNLREDSLGRIWSQMQVYDPRQNRIDRFGPAEGAAFGTYWFFANTALPDGRLLFGGSAGVLQVAPLAYHSPPRSTPVVLSSLRVNGQPVPASVPSGGLPLPPGTRSLGVEFAGLDYADPSRLRYQYRLRGLDEAWTETDAGQRNPSFGPLQPGRYTLQVRASALPGQWGDQLLELPFDLQPAWWQTHWATAALLFATLAGLWGVVRWRTASLRRREAELSAEVEARTAELREASLTDALTGLRNRRYLDLRLPDDLRLCLRRHASPPPPPDSDLVLMLLDLDHFKQVNDLYGHAAGDAVLVQLAERLRGVFRASDSLVRWGGEEVLALVRETSRDDAPELAARVCEAVRNAPFVLEGGQVVGVTVSIGFAAFPLDSSRPDSWGWAATLQMADAALYAAKAQGRDGYLGALRAIGLAPQDVPQQLGRWLNDPRLEVRRGQGGAAPAPP